MIYAGVTGDREVLAALRILAPALRAAVYAEVETQAIDLTSYIQESYLSGQALKNRSGHLRASINHLMHETDTTITGTVGSSNRDYAAYHEFGFHGVEKVTSQRGRLFDRHVNYAGHPYMRPGLADRRSLIVQGIEAAVARAMRP